MLQRTRLGIAMVPAQRAGSLNTVVRRHFLTVYGAIKIAVASLPSILRQMNYHVWTDASFLRGTRGLSRLSREFLIFINRIVFGIRIILQRLPCGTLV